jgi:hypothetical protein
MERDELIDLRPMVAFDAEKITTELEEFQNTVLRPILKFQHPIFVQLLLANKHFEHLKANKSSRNNFLHAINQFVSGQHYLKDQFVGIVLGLMTLEELIIYQRNASALNKRIHQMVCQRLCDALY